MVLLVGGLVIASAYIHSDSFTDSIGDSLSAVLGESVELGSELQITSVYPQIRMVLPDAKLRVSGKSNGIQRGRLQNLRLAISPVVLFSGGSRGKLNITIGNVTIISRSGEPETNPKDRANESNSDMREERSLADQVTLAKNRITNLDVTLNIDEFSFYERNKKKGNSLYRLSHIQIVSESGNAIRASASLHDGDEVKQSFTSEVVSELPDSQGIHSNPTGTFTVNLSALADQYESHNMLGKWEIQDNTLTLGALEYKSDDAWLKGEASIDYSLSEIHIKSDLELRKLDIKSSQSDDYVPAPAASSTRLFSYELFGSGIPKTLSADVKLHLGAIRMNGLPVINGQLLFRLSEGAIEVSSDELSLFGGEADLLLEVDTGLPQFVDVKLKFEVDDAQLDRIRSPDGNDTILSRGTADIILALRGSGPSPGHLVATLDGYVIAGVGNAQIKQKYTTLMDVGVVSWAIDKLSLLSKEGDARRTSANLSDPLTIECASLRLYINDGRVEVSNGAIIEFPDNVLFSSGYVDLHSETLGFAFRTKSRSLFDWSAISIAKYAEIGGSLATPSITLNAVELAKQGVKSASSMVWGPLPSLVYSLAESGVKNMQAAKCSPDID